MPEQPEARLDLLELPGVIHVGEFRNLCRVRHVASGQEVALPNARYHLVVVDPPHTTENCANNKIGRKYRATDAHMQHQPDISFLYAPFLAQATRVLTQAGALVGLAERKDDRVFQPLLAELASGPDVAELALTAAEALAHPTLCQALIRLTGSARAAARTALEIVRLRSRLTLTVLRALDPTCHVLPYKIPKMMS